MAADPGIDSVSFVQRQPIAPCDISDRFVELVEDRVGGSDAWDCIDPKEVIAAVLETAKESGFTR